MLDNSTVSTEAVADVPSAPAPTPIPHYKTFLPLLGVIVVGIFSFSLVLPIMVSLFSGQTSIFGIKSIGLQHFCLSLSFLLYPLGLFFGLPLMRDLSAYWGQKKVFVLSMIIMAYGFFAMAVAVMAHSVFLLVLARVVTGLMAGSLFLAQEAVMELYGADNREAYFKFMIVLVGGSLGVGALLGGVFTSLHSAVPLVIAAIFCGLVYHRFETEGIEAVVSVEQKPLDLLRPVTILTDAFRQRSLYFWLSALVLTQLAFAFYIQYTFVILSHHYHYPAAALGLFGAALAGLFVVGFWGPIRAFMFGRFSSDGSLVIGLMLVAIVQVATAMMGVFGGYSWIIWVLAIPMMVLNMVVYLLVLNAFCSAVPKESPHSAKNMAFSIMAMVWVITGFCANFMSYGMHVLVCWGGFFAFAAFVLIGVQVLHKIGTAPPKMGGGMIKK